MKNSLTRREALGLGLGAVALGASGTVIASAQPGKKPPARAATAAPECAWRKKSFKSRRTTK